MLQVFAAFARPIGQNFVIVLQINMSPAGNDRGISNLLYDLVGSSEQEVSHNYQSLYFSCDMLSQVGSLISRCRVEARE